jgi:hypothetical protein
LKNLPILQHTKTVPPKGWKVVKFTNECPPCEICGEPWCEDCQKHYVDCDCPGPTDDGWYYKEYEGYLFATQDPDLNKLRWSNQTPAGQDKTAPSPERGKLRSKTHSGIAAAMAEQWG